MVLEGDYIPLLLAQYAHSSPHIYAQHNAQYQPSAITHHASRITHASITPNSKQQSTNNKQNAARNNLSIEKRMPVTALSEEEEMMRTTVHKFSKDRIAPKVREMDEKAYHIKT